MEQKSFRRLLLLALMQVIAFYGIGQAIQMKLESSDLLPASFHAERRQAFRNLMPDNSVAVIFSYPERTFSNDVSYVYHQNPNMYYLSGYKEPDAVLVICKEMQQGTDGDSYNELLFVRKRNAEREQWTGRRLGVAGAKEKLGFTHVYNGEEFGKFPVDFQKFSMVLYDVLPDEASTSATPGDLPDLVNIFKSKMDISPAENKLLQEDLVGIARNINTSYFNRYLTRIANRSTTEAYKNNPFVVQLLANPNEQQMQVIAAAIKSKYAGIAEFSRIMGTLREIKTPEELSLLRKSVEISSQAHLEVMRAIKPEMSERELEGIFTYVHKKYGAEDEGYPPIVGAGQNGCILHYIDNSAPEVDNQLVLMDVGSEYHGYSADVTRTIPASGKFTPEQKAIYQLVYDAQEVVFKLCREGVAFSALNEAAKDVLAKGLMELGILKNASQLSKFYMHGVSHHLGLDVHDKFTNHTLKENMVITVEPGIYISAGSYCDPKWWNIAVRIEDDVRVGKKDCEILSSSAPRSVDAVEKAIAENSYFNQFKFPALKE